MIRRALTLLLTISTLNLCASAQAVNGAEEASAIAAADQLFASGRVAEAGARYGAIANADPSSVQAQVGLIRSYLVLQKIDEAEKAADTALLVSPNSALLVMTMGDVQFRQGKIPDAERSFVKAQNLQPDDAAPYISLARVYRAYSLYRRAYDNMQRAHELAPNEMAVQLLWVNSLPQSDRIPELESYLASAPGQKSQVAQQLRQYLAQLQKNAAEPVHACKLVSNVQETNTKLYAIPRPGTQLGATGLAVKLNKQEMHLALDTGASGVLLGRAAAEKAGLQRLAYQPIAGMGDNGQQGGYTAAVDRIRIGDLEFQDCMVRVTDSATPVTGQDGLIGADVFDHYLIDIDIPGAKLRLSPLPKRPGQATAAPATLTTEAENGEELKAENSPAAATGPAGKPAAELNLPKDAYVAPEMANWSKVYRFRSLLLTPTKIDGIGPMLFLLDTGSFSNILSTRAASRVTQVRSNPSQQVRGLGGSVANVYSAEKANIEFGIGPNGVGRYAQQNQDIVTFDLTNICRETGTEVSGILGFAMLRILQIRIDYRDGLVDFIFDPKHLPKGLAIKR